MVKPLNIAIVGCGKNAMNHYKALQSMPDKYKLSALCDINSSSLEQFNNPDISKYNHLSELLDDNTIDIITLCSPSGLHAQQAIAIANKKKHVITEKPMATRWHDGLEMIKASDEAKTKLFVVKQNRYQPALQLLKNAIQKNRFGKIYLVAVNVFWTRPQEYYDQSEWRGTWEFDGGALMNQASHYVDLLTWLFGPVQQVNAMLSTLAIKMEAEDTGVVNIRWRSGILGSMNVTILTYPKNLEASITVLGEKGSARIGGTSANKIEHWQFLDPVPEDEALTTINTSSVNAIECYQRYYDDVFKTLNGEKTTIVDGRAGLRTLELLTASYLSARDQKVVNLPLIY